MSISVRELTRQELSELKEDNRYGFKLLEIKNREATCKMIVQQIDFVVGEFQNDCRKGTRDSAGHESVELAFGLGAVWGNQLVKEFGWSWVCLSADGLENLVVASAERSMFIAPAPAIKNCVDNPHLKSNILFVFELIESGKLDSLPPEGYANVMVSIQNSVQESMPPVAQG
ncbi:MAG: hypothetical protein K8F91_10355 [Candidatus Obscuribacterales bacterium]|nr:hypothetical protein [Candidatus Obscuribacterales bacterium]